ncbi:hypothetical protein PF005_g23007 [Phytophthora fragariae]|uniref:Uncharacterized protein n=3 Tax=Phytophthora fragariae TaxID=53985 RepID=A0A6A3W9E6_9STRA|nr:hypothetical protein PF005_g23007 [Phytophthora fragariae]
MGLKAESEQQDGWTTVGGRRARVQGETKDDKTRSGGGGRDPSTAGPGRLIKVSPLKTQNKNKTEGILQSKNGGEGEGGDAKKGRETFKQLRRYLLQDAKQEYVLHTIIRLGELASSRRFLHWVMAHKKDGRTEQELKKDLKDQPTAAQTDMYQNWVVTENLDQDEVERRLHFFHIQGGPESKAAVSSSGTAGNSYLGAVNSGRTMSGGKVETNEQKWMEELCTRPVERVVELRGRTADEDRALIMILNHELELARPPTFLIQSMDAEELAVFTDLFHAIEYPLYAHLAPGQRFDNDMACESILRMVHAGREAAPQHKQEILEFKAAMSRILQDAETRLITVTFKGKQSAGRRIGWKMPFAAKLLPLVDYKQQREEAKKTHALVQIDFYESPSKRGQQEPIDRPVLPMEWEMHRQPVHQQEEELVDHERQCADGGCKLEKESKTEESTPPYYGTMSPEENNSNLPEDNVEQQAAEGDFDGAGDEKMREVSVEGENVNTQSEAGSSKDEDVNPDGIARVQAYAYRTVKLEDEDVFESGTVHTLETRSTIQMWKELIGEGFSYLC